MDNIRQYDPNGEKIKLTCAILERNESLQNAHVDDANAHNVTLKGAIPPKGKKLSEPEIEWLNGSSALYYHHVFDQDASYNFIIGHAPLFVFGAENLKRVYKGDNVPKVVLFVHTLPKTTKGDLEKATLYSWIKGTEIFFSIGENVRNELDRFVRGMQHEMYIPLGHGKIPPGIQTVRENELLIAMAVGSQDFDFNGLDVMLGVEAADNAVKEIQLRRNLGEKNRLGIALFVEQSKDGQILKEEIAKRFPNVLVTILTFESSTHIQSLLLQSSVFLLPLKKNHPQFGNEALSAATAGVPILVSGNSGVAELLSKHGEIESIVTSFDPKIWKDKIVQKILYPELARENASRLRQKLLRDGSLRETHLRLISKITGK